MSENYSQFPQLGFLVFRSRSGSTLIGDRIARHPDILVTPESNVAPRLVKYFQQVKQDSRDIDYLNLVNYVFQEKKLSEWQIDYNMLFNAFQENQVDDWATAFYTLCRLYRDTEKPKAKMIILKKNGWYYKNVELLFSTFPSSFIIWIVRDPRAIYNSARQAIHSERKEPMATNIVSNAFGWCDYMKRLKKAEFLWSAHNFRISYEGFLQNPEATLIRLWKGLGVATLDDSTMKEVLNSKEASSLITTSTAHLHGNVSKELMLDRATQWKKQLPRWRSFLIKAITYRYLKEFEYD